MIGQDVVIRNANYGDWSGFRKVDEACFSDSGISLIAKSQFEAWLEVYPEGFYVAEKNGEIGGYIYLQICDFDPFNIFDNRNFDEITDHGYTYESHDASGSCLYVVSVAAVNQGVGRRLISQTIKNVEVLKKKYYAGACRMPGLKKFMTSYNLLPSAESVDLYVKLVSDSIKGKRKGEEKYFDPVLSVLLKIENSYVARLIKDFINDDMSLGWASVVYYENRNTN